MLLPAVLALMQILSVPSRPITVAAGDANRRCHCCRRRLSPPPSRQTLNPTRKAIQLLNRTPPPSLRRRQTQTMHPHRRSRRS